MSDLLTNEQYIERNWAKMSPKFRDAHNHLRRVRGLTSIPEPKIDLWIPPRAPDPKAYDFANSDFVGAARQFLGHGMMAPGEEGFTVNGREAR